ncbi:hypothetical protein [Hymenobacter metallicola]|uniref:Uncharacterized protein n=1 Tax=Hymenobacter metallicola TaxID=2563114 RepID=A0A4Z0QCA2_9BACT|nr:hypothetical protein [Hymenobacter metallicola]TGE27728.1 hypothetical protein E5K02_15290 [Hymenobacter metallicola]
MYKTILILLCAFMCLLEPQATQAAPADAFAVRPELVENNKVPRPNYKAYRGNSRHKAKKLGVFKRWSLRRKAMRKRKRKMNPVIRVEKPTRNK